MKEKLPFVKPTKPTGNSFYYTLPDMDKNKRLSCVIYLSAQKKVDKVEITLSDYSNVDMEIILKHTVIKKDAEELLKFFDRVLWVVADPK